MTSSDQQGSPCPVWKGLGQRGGYEAKPTTAELWSQGSITCCVSCLSCWSLLQYFSQQIIRYFTVFWKMWATTKYFSVAETIIYALKSGPFQDIPAPWLFSLRASSRTLLYPLNCPPPFILTTFPACLLLCTSHRWIFLTKFLMCGSLSFAFSACIPEPLNTSNSSAAASACTVCQTRTDSTRKLLRYWAGVRQSSETRSHVTVRVSSYPRTRPALSALPHSAHSPAPGLGLALARSCSHVPQCSPWLLGVPHLSKGLAFSWKYPASQHLRHCTIGGSSFDAPGRQHWEAQLFIFCPPTTHEKESTQQKKSICWFMVTQESFFSCKQHWLWYK